MRKLKWKGNPNYRPKYGLSIRYLKMIMTAKEYKELERKYIAAKLEEHIRKL